MPLSRAGLWGGQKTASDEFEARFCWQKQSWRYNGCKVTEAFLPITYLFEGFELDIARYELRRNGHVLRLEKIPMELLILLVSRKGELVSREEIVERLWGNDVFIETGHGVNTAVRKVRQTLGDDPERPRFVQTVVGKGYRFVATTHALPAAVATAVSGNGHGKVALGSTGSDPGGRPSNSAKGRRERWRGSAFIMVGTVATVIALVFFGLAGLPRPPLLNDRITVAVLPFANLSGDPAEEYLSDGMTEEVITALGQVNAERLGVIARTSAMRYKHTDRDVRQIGRDLGADFILEGSIRRAGNRIRVTAQLVKARDQTNLWSQDYDSLGFNEIPGVQAQIRNAVAKALRLETEAKLGSAVSVDPEAYQLYLKGRYFLDRRDQASLEKALDYFQNSAARDGEFAHAWASVALSYELLEYVRAIRPADSHPNALSAARRALQIDPGSSEAHTALAYIHEHYEWNWSEADRELTRALILDPNYELARQWSSYGLLRRGDVQGAVVQMRRALALDPVSFRVNVTMAERLERAGQHDEAIEQYLTALELSPDDAGARRRLGELYGKKGDGVLAAREYERGLELSGDHELEQRFDRLNRREGFTAAFSAIEAERLRTALHALEVRAARGEYVSPSDYAIIYARLNDSKKALDWLQRAYDEHASVMLELGDPIFDKIRESPEFKELERRLGTPMIHES